MIRRFVLGTVLFTLLIGFSSCSGKEKGKTGKIIKVIRDKDRIIVEKLNFVKRHQRPDYSEN